MKGDYANGKIYKVVALNGTEDEVYYGTSTQPLHKRYEKHRSNYKYWKKKTSKSYVSCFDLFEKYTVENCRIMLVELFPCNTVEELRAREGFYIKNNQCVNKLVAGRTQTEYKQDNRDDILLYQKQYYEENVEKLAEKRKVYRAENAELVKERQKQYYEDNVEQIKQYNKEYQQKNVEKLAEKGKVYRAENAELVKERKKQYYENNKIAIAEQKKQYRENNKQKIAENQKQYRQNNKEKIKQYLKEYYQRKKT